MSSYMPAYGQEWWVHTPIQNTEPFGPGLGLQVNAQVEEPRKIIGVESAVLLNDTTSWLKHLITLKDTGCEIICFIRDVQVQIIDALGLEGCGFEVMYYYSNPQKAAAMFGINVDIWITEGGR